MKQMFIAFCAMSLGFTATAQTNSPAATSPMVSAPAPAQVPESTSTTSPDNARYLNYPDLLTACTARVAAFDTKPCDIIFIGDSITARWINAGKAIWDSSYAPRNALDFGIDGDKTQNVLWRLSNMSVQNLKPKVAVVMIGTNNLENTPHEIADGVKAVLANTQEAFPGVKIILVSIMPNMRANDKMMQVNSLIKSYADDSSVYFLDLVPLMPPVTKTAIDGQVDTNYTGLGPDHLHPDLSGYQIWADAMEPLLKKLLAGGED
jgi:lysophospholipase L1-like esterase